MGYLNRHGSTRQTPQSQPIPGTVPNSAGGHAFPVDDWGRMGRFLVLGSEGGSYYAAEQAFTRENALALERCLHEDGRRFVATVALVSESGRAPKQDPALFALAMALKLGAYGEVRQLARAAVPEVCRTGTHILKFAQYIELFGGWGRGTRGAVADWFVKKGARELAYQVTKYQNRDGWSMRDLLRLAHPWSEDPSVQGVLRYVAKGKFEDSDAFTEYLAAVELAKTAPVHLLVQLIREWNLPRECIPTPMLTNPTVWDALFEKMPLTALIRNLATMTRLGLIAPLSAHAEEVAKRVTNAEALKKARVHPVQLLSALLTYRAGHGARGKHSWSPVAQVVDALDAAFYQSFQFVQPTGKRHLLALDVSGSMGGGEVAGVPGLTPRVASAAMALVTAASEPAHAFVAFTNARMVRSAWTSSQAGAGQHGGYGLDNGISPLTISPRQRLDDVCRQVAGLPFGGTDCSLPILYAEAMGIEVDAFVIYTDNETWAGNIHPSQALRRYRERTGIAAKLIVVGMVSNGFTIADPNDGGMLDVVGFDTNAPSLMGDFVRG